jgi:hypothetical protein
MDVIPGTSPPRRIRASDNTQTEQRRHPALLIQQVMDQRPHVPLRAGSAIMSLPRAQTRDQRAASHLVRQPVRPAIRR